MRIEDLRPARGSVRERKRLGRGTASGQGKTSGKGTKGQQSRSGGGVRPGFEGGQMPLYRRLPKRGFLPYGGKHEFAIVNVGVLAARFAAGSVVDPAALVAAGLIKKSAQAAVKVLGDGELGHALTVRVHRVTGAARQKLEGAGGTIELLGGRAARARP